jgi:hypothetical protein
LLFPRIIFVAGLQNDVDSDLLTFLPQAVPLVTNGQRVLIC